MKRLCAVLFVLTLGTLASGQGWFGAKVAGTVAPDGKTEVQLDLPASLHKHNISSARLGCCVFRSGDHAAHWSNEPALMDWPEWMVKKGIPGGGYPEKVTKLVKQIAKDRGMPEPVILQVEGKDIEIIKLAARNGLMPCVTYGQSPTGRYGGQLIDHMVNLVHADDQWFCVLDNNYVDGPQHLEWMTPAEFQRAYTIRGGGWSYFILKPPPPPPPKN